MTEGSSRAARAAALIVALALAGVACGGEPETFAAVDQAPAATIVTARQAREFVPAPEDVLDLTEEEPNGAGPGAAAPREIGPPGNPVAETLADPPQSGRYPHRLTASGAFGAQVVSFEVDIEEPREAGGGREQVQFWDIPDFEQSFVYRWTPQQLHLIEVTATGPDGREETCRYDPPLLQVQLPISVGSTWEAESTCGDTRERGTAEVIRTEQLTIGGVTVDTFVIQSTGVSRRGDTREEETAIVWYAPEQRLFVRLETETENPEVGTIRIEVEATSVVPL